MILTKLNGWSNWPVNQRSGRRAVSARSRATSRGGALPGEPWLPPVPPAPLRGGKLCSPHEEAKAATHRDAQRWMQGTLLPLHAQSRHNLSLKCPRQVLSQAHGLKDLCIFLKVYLAFLTSRKSKNLYLNLDLVVCQPQPSLPPFHPSIISSTYMQYWIRLFSYRKVNARKISLRIRSSPWQTEAFLQEAAAV